MMYPPKAATLRGKVYSIKLCLSEKFCIFSAIIWLCKDKELDEFTTIAGAAARL